MRLDNYNLVTMQQTWNRKDVQRKEMKLNRERKIWDAYIETGGNVWPIKWSEIKRSEHLAGCDLIGHLRLAEQPQHVNAVNEEQIRVQIAPPGGRESRVLTVVSGCHRADCLGAVLPFWALSPVTFICGMPFPATNILHSTDTTPLSSCNLTVKIPGSVF